MMADQLIVWMLGIIGTLLVAGVIAILSTVINLNLRVTSIEARLTDALALRDERIQQLDRRFSDKIRKDGE